MKTWTILPILAAGANKKNERGYEDWGKTSDISEYSEECLTQVPSKNGIFKTENFGTRGEIVLDEYSRGLRCKHDVQADSSCSEIKISYRSIAVMVPVFLPDCTIDGFRLSWTDNETGDLSVTPLRCNCFGDGCDHDYQLSGWFDYVSNFIDSSQHLGPEEFTIKSNSFTLYFESLTQWHDDSGHVILDWECVATTTTTTTTTTSATTT